MLEEATLDNTWLMGNEPPDKGDEALFVRFHLKPRRDEAQSKLHGRPIFKNVEYIHIGAPGDKFSVIDRPATPRDRTRFRNHYRAFKESQTEVQTGTPLEKWPMIDATQVEELKYFSIRTVEQLALMPDGNIPNVGNISHLKKQAADYLEAAKGLAPMVQMRAELEKRDAEMAALRQQVADMAAQMSGRASQPVQVAAPAPKKRGRPAKQPEPEAPQE